MLSIGSFSRAAHLTTKTLRYYDEIGLLKPAYVDSDTGYRFYDVAQLQSVLLIGRLKAYGFSLEEIAAVLENPKDTAALLPAIRQKKTQLEGMLQSYAAVLGAITKDIANLERGNDLMSYLDTIQVDITETQAMNLLYVRAKMNPQKEYGGHMASLMQRVADEKLTPAGAPLSIFHGEEFDPESYDMEIAIPVQENVEGTREMPACRCAHATLKGDYSGLTSAYAKIREWMEQQGYTAAGPAFEIYMTDPSKTAPEENITEVYVPVQKA